MLTLVHMVLTHFVGVGASFCIQCEGGHFGRSVTGVDGQRILITQAPYSSTSCPGMTIQQRLVSTTWTQTGQVATLAIAVEGLVTVNRSFWILIIAISHNTFIIEPWYIISVSKLRKCCLALALTLLAIQMLNSHVKKAYSRHLAYPNVIRVQVGSKDHDEGIPAELCHITADQRYTHKLPSEFSSPMIHQEKGSMP